MWDNVSTRPMARVAVLLVLLFAWAFTGKAQDARATLSGVVTDVSGASVVGAAVTLTNIDTGVGFKTTTNTAGQYPYMFLDPGIYRLAGGLRKERNEANGFR